MLILASSIAVARSVVALAPETKKPSGPLIRAILAADYAKAKDRVSRGENPNESDQDGVTALMNAIGVRQSALVTALLDHGARVNDKDRKGQTALMVACLLREADLVRTLLDHKADPNARTSRGDATPVTIAAYAGSADNLRLLLDHGGDVNAVGRRGDSLLLIALRKANGPMVDLLLSRGNSVQLANKDGETPLMLAASTGSVDLVKQLLAKGADPRGVDLDGRTPLFFAARAGSSPCIDVLLAAGADPRARDTSGRTTLSFVRGTEAGAIVDALKPGAGDLNIGDRWGCTALMRAATRGDIATVKALVRRGANASVVDMSGRTALDRARAVGNADAASELGAGQSAEPVGLRDAVLKRTVQKSVRLLERSSTKFREMVGGTCFSCHNQTMPQVALAAARERGFTVDTGTVAKDVAAVHSEYVRCSSTLRDALAQRKRTADEAFGARFPGGAAHVGYGLVGIRAWGTKPDAATKSVVTYLTLTQEKDGHWQTQCDVRAPAEKSNFTETALAIFGLRYYGNPGRSPAVARSIDLARAWLAKTPPQTTEDKTFRLFGLAWSGLAADSTEVRGAVQMLLKEQQMDGGWAQEPGMDSDSYATGEVLVALHRAGGLGVTDPTYRAGANFLLRTVEEDGSWFVRSRTVPFQGFIETNYPYRQDQFISINAACWATTALAESLPLANRIASTH
jgi:ankyrin repeat protein